MLRGATMRPCEVSREAARHWIPEVLGLLLPLPGEFALAAHYVEVLLAVGAVAPMGWL